MNTEVHLICKARPVQNHTACPQKAPDDTRCMENPDSRGGSSSRSVDSTEAHCPSPQSGPTKPKVAFLCVHNSCRSQIAEALGKKLAGDVFESFSAGTEPGAQINPDAVRLMKQVYGIDMERTQHSKSLTQLPAVDIVVTMGCNVQCPTLPCSHREDWGLDDPSGRADSEFLAVMERIEEKILDLKHRIQTGVLE